VEYPLNILGRTPQSVMTLSDAEQRKQTWNHESFHRLNHQEMWRPIQLLQHPPCAIRLHLKGLCHRGVFSRAFILILNLS